jgi:hypothetical protein
MGFGNVQLIQLTPEAVRNILVRVALLDLFCDADCHPSMPRGILNTSELSAISQQINPRPLAVRPEELRSDPAYTELAE